MEIILLLHNSLSLSIRSNLLLCPSSLALLLCLYVGGFNVISLLFLFLVLPQDSHPRKGKEECLLLSLCFYIRVYVKHHTSTILLLRIHAHSVLLLELLLDFRELRLLQIRKIRMLQRFRRMNSLRWIKLQHLL